MKASFFKSLKAKIFLMVGIPILGLIVVASITYFASQGQMARAVAMGDLNELQSIALSMKVSSHAIPRYLWVAFAVEGGVEKRQTYVKRSVENLEKIKKNSAKFLEMYQAKAEVLSLSPSLKEHGQAIAEQMGALTEMVEKVHGLLLSSQEVDGLAVKKILLQDMLPVMLAVGSNTDDLNSVLDQDGDNYIKQGNERSREAFNLRMMIIGLVIAVSLGIAFLITSVVTKKLLFVTEHVSSSTQQVASASHQISGASQQLASASQTQASAIEETSAALAEMSGMVEKNTKNAEVTADLAKNVRNNAETSVSSMVELIRSMQEIQESNKKIENLVKVIEEIGEKTSVIDEIVFQTKLLSFNASVEAERAGEHGRGFAVVAQEVGNLAQMSGRSALEISAIVKQSVKEAIQIAQENREKVERGNHLVEMTEKALREVQDSAKNVLELSQQVLNASREQNTGINQINASVDNINKTTQETSATAEEAAGAAEELSSQSSTLQAMVQDLQQVVTGSSEEAPTRAFQKPSNVVAFNPRKIEPAGEFKMAVGRTSALSSWEKL